MHMYMKTLTLLHNNAWNTVRRWTSKVTPLSIHLTSLRANICTTQQIWVLIKCIAMNCWQKPVFFPPTEFKGRYGIFKGEGFIKRQWACVYIACEKDPYPLSTAACPTISISNLAHDPAWMDKKTNPWREQEASLAWYCQSSKHIFYLVHVILEYTFSWASPPPTMPPLSPPPHN